MQRAAFLSLICPSSLEDSSRVVQVAGLLPGAVVVVFRFIHPRFLRVPRKLSNTRARPCRLKVSRSGAHIPSQYDDSAGSSSGRREIKESEFF